MLALFPEKKTIEKVQWLKCDSHISLFKKLWAGSQQGLNRSRKWNSPEKRPQRCLAGWEGRGGEEREAGSTFLACRHSKSNELK